MANPKKVMILSILANFPFNEINKSDFEEIAYMTENEFLRLEIGTVISDRFKENIYFVMDHIDQMGTAYKEQKHIIYGAKQIGCETNYARIDIGNCNFWKIEGFMQSAHNVGCD